ncbi:hypothetical protein [Nocardia sp. NRRL S-836]|nr:hypothetical protein [Nocardia sp. NRRL S-836]
MSTSGVAEEALRELAIACGSRSEVGERAPSEFGGGHVCGRVLRT